jgi:hypothetical protein
MFAAGAAVGGVVVALIWVMWAVTSPSDSDGVGEAQPASQGLQPQQTYEQRCAEVFEAQTGPLNAGARSMTQWEVHIGAMNKLVTGALTLQQATQFWNQTRVGAERLLARYRTAEDRFDDRTARCPRPESGQPPSSAAAPCVEAVAARGKVLRTMDVALATWRGHVHHMEMLRNGEMSPAEATRLWLATWRAGAEEVQVYRTAERAAQGATC